METTKTERIEQLEKALALAQAHIGWLWDTVEEKTTLRRAGSDAILATIREALA